MDDIDETSEDDDIVEDDEDLDDLEPPEEALRETPPTEPDPTTEREVGSLEELLVKKEAQAEEEATTDDDEESLASLSREERLEPLAVKVVPPQASEFVCKNCYLVKHRSQLKDKKKMLCRDCA